MNTTDANNGYGIGLLLLDVLVIISVLGVAFL